MESIAKRRKRTSDARAFDFSSDCFFCGDPAQELVNNRKICIKYVKNDKLRMNILHVIEEKPAEDVDDNLKTLQLCLNDVVDLAAINARYHSSCLVKFFSSRNTNLLGRPISDSVSKLIEHIKNHVFENLEICQFSLKKILSTFDDEVPKLDRLKTFLTENFGDEISMYHKKQDLILCFRDAGNNVPTSSWFAMKSDSSEAERKRIVEMAANIIYQDIRASFYETENYNAPSNFLNNIKADIPSTLLSFLNVLITSSKRYSKTDDEIKNKKWENRMLTIAHILISSVRPRQFVSPIMLGLSSMLHKKHGSKDLIDCLSFLGLCSSYTETLLFEASIVNQPEHYNLKDATFLQFVFDNADHNTNTIDGNNTFHAMGGIMCVTPSSSVESGGNIKRLSKMSSSGEIGKFGFILLKHFQKGSSLGLKEVTIKDVHVIKPTSTEIEFNCADIVWLFGKQNSL